jgi:branched-chain amino acid transport system ATP-binding protein
VSDAATPAVEPSTAPVANDSALLELREVSAGYGAFRALFDVSLDLGEAKVLALLGSNGAGKTTIARVASGLVRPTSGSVFFQGMRIDKLRPYRIARLGIIHAPEGRSVFASLTVEENLVLSFRREFGRAGVGEALHHAYELFPRLGERRKQVAGTLSGGEQRMLSLARVLVKPPKLLIADELSLGLAPIVVDEVYKTLQTVRSTGTALLIVEQHVGHALAIADDVAVLNKGRVVYGGPVAELGDLSEWLLPAAREDTAAAPEVRADLNGQG